MSQSVSEIGGSLGDYMSSVRAAFDRQFPAKRNGDMISSNGFWVRDIFEDYIIVNDEGTAGGLWRVDYRKPATAAPQGHPPLGAGGPAFVFDTRDKWQRVKLAYTKEIVGDTIVTEFAGKPPEIQPRAGVDLAELTAGDPDPFYLTVEISTIGRTSKNGLIHDATLADSLVTQINGRAAEGIMGHIKETERSTAYPTSDIHWLGAARSGSSVWARGYIPKTATAQREHFRILKATKGRAATSITGPAVREFVDKKAGTWKATGFQLEQLDLAPHTRAALPPESDFMITREMGDQYQLFTEDNMSKEQILAELTAADVPAAVRAQIVREAAGQAPADRVQELTQLNTSQAAVINELQEQITTIRLAEFNTALDAKLTELMPWPAATDDAKKKLEALRGTVRGRILQELDGKQDKTLIAELANKVWAELTPLAETVRDALAGGPAVVGRKVRTAAGATEPGGETWRDELAANAGKLRKEKGI